MTNKYPQKISVNKVYKSVKQILEKARNNAYRAINFAMVVAYWQVGKVIVEEEQKGKKRAEYGSALIKELSQRLFQEYGAGFDESNLRKMRQFYLTFQIQDALRPKLSWTHYRLLSFIKS